MNDSHHVLVLSPTDPDEMTAIWEVVYQAMSAHGYLHKIWLGTLAEARVDGEVQ